jgi:hypothetical protein
LPIINENEAKEEIVKYFYSKRRYNEDAKYIKIISIDSENVYKVIQIESIKKI